MSRVLVSLVNSIKTVGDEPEHIRLMTTGTLTPTPEGYHLHYQESQPDGSEIQDIDLDLSPGQVIMTRSGDYGSTLVFRKDHLFEGVYHTPFGEMDIGIFPSKVQVETSDDLGHIDLVYQLNFKGSYAAMNYLTVKYRKTGRSS